MLIIIKTSFFSGDSLITYHNYSANMHTFVYRNAFGYCQTASQSLLLGKEPVKQSRLLQLKECHKNTLVVQRMLCKKNGKSLFCDL